MSAWAYDLCTILIVGTSLAIIAGLTPTDSAVGVALLGAAVPTIALSQREKTKARAAEAAKTGSVPIQEPKP